VYRTVTDVDAVDVAPWLSVTVRSTLWTAIANQLPGSRCAEL
jgi:hypothetical protein